MKKFLLTAVAVLALTACTDENGAVKALRAQGYTDIQMTGYAPLSCSKDDSYRTGFRAKTPAGVVVEGVVCAGWLKGATIRTF